MMRWSDHVIILPIVLPLLAAAITLLLDERRRRIKATIGLIAMLFVLASAIALMPVHEGDTASVGVYRLGNWPAPFGIVLVADRLAPLMVLVASLLGLAALAYSLARWHRAGPHFHALFLFMLAGVNGAFLTGDLFNLFVFFELLLAGSFGLALHGSGIARVKASLHYIAVNLAGSMLFLIGVALIYGVTGTLNMADLAIRIGEVPAGDRVLLEAGAGILGVAFLVKAAMWPLGFWLPGTYGNAAPPVAAIFAIMTKVGLYILLRLTLLFFGENAGPSEGFGGTWLVYGGLATIAFGAIGVLAAQDLRRVAGYSLLVSSGTILVPIGAGDPASTAPLLFYLVSSTLGIGALYLLIELIERGREAGADMLAITMEAYGEDEEEDLEEDEIGVPVPATMAILGVSFVCCALMIAGLPPLSGFLAKFALLSTALSGGILEERTAPPTYAWLFMTLVIVSGATTIVSMTRAGISNFWAPIERTVPRVGIIEIAPVAILLLICLVLTVQAGPVMRYLEATAHTLHAPQDYVRSVMPPVADRTGASP